MASDQGPIVQSLLLRTELVRLRNDLDLTQEVVARSLDWHPSKIMRIEGGKSKIATTDLRALLDEYGVKSESRRERLEVLAQGARKSGWWAEYRGVVDEASLTFIGYEAGASVIRHFQNTVIPGPLQTRDYGRALMSSIVEDKDEGDERKVEFRLRREKELEQRAKPPRRFYLLDEAVIRRHVGVDSDPDIMPAQLRYVADLAADDPRITVRVIPFSKGAHAGMGGPFVLLEFDGGLAEMLYREASSAWHAQSAITSEDDTVTDYQAAFESITELALSPEESITMLRAAADELGSSIS